MSSISSPARYAFLTPCSILASFAIGSITIAAGAGFAQATPDAAKQSDAQRLAANNQTSHYNFRYVDPAKGNDQHSGQLQAPLRTITQALATAPANTIIILAPGTYSATTGEKFPIVMRSGITLQGQAANRGRNVIIKGSGTYLSRTFARQNITMLGANRAGLRGVTVTNPTPQGYGLWVESTSPVITDNQFVGSGHDGVSIVGSSAPILKGNHFSQNGANGLTIYGHSRPNIIENRFDNTGFGINIAQNSAPRLIGNRIIRNKDGIIIQGNAQPVLRNNVISDNDRDGIVTINQAIPHLGSRQDPGNNRFARNGKFDINAVAAKQTIPAAGNQFRSSRGKLDKKSTIGVRQPRVQRVASVKPVRLKREIRIGSDTLETAKPAVTIPPIEEQNLPLLRLPAIPKRLAPKLHPVARPVDTKQMRQFGNAATSRRSLPTVPDLRVSKPSVLGGTATNLAEEAAQTDNGSIPITVPQPNINSGAIVPTSEPARGVVVVDRPVSKPSRRANILPVPSGKIPVGNVGRAKSVWRKPSRSKPQPTQFKLRVYIPKVSRQQLKQLRELVPGAFNARVNGKLVIQVGAFNDRTKANELVSQLNRAGLSPIVAKY